MGVALKTMTDLHRLLAERGVSVPSTKPKPPCMGGCGKAVDADGDMCRPCASAWRARRREAVLRDAYASLPSLEWCRFGNEKAESVLRPAQELRAIMSSWNRAKGSLLLLGPTGVGKSVSMVCLAHMHLDAARDNDATDERAEARLRAVAGIRYANAADLARARRNYPLGHGDPPALTDAYECSLLLLDELGREPDGDMTIFEVVDARARRGLPIIAATNLVEQQIRKKYLESGARRLMEFGRVVHVRGGG